MTTNLDLNRVDETDLERLGIERQHAREIINYRTRNGPFKNWEDLKKFGLTNDMIDNLKLDGLYVGKVA